MRCSSLRETVCAIYITNNPSQTGYSRSGEQKAGGLFLILFSVKAGGEIRAAVRSVQMRQSGHFMVGEAKLAGIPVFLSGPFGGDGLTKNPPPGIWEQLVPLPDGLARGFWKDISSSERDLRAWAKTHIEELRKAAPTPRSAPKRRKGKPARLGLQTIATRRMQRRFAKHGQKVSKRKALDLHYSGQFGTLYGDPLAERADYYKRARESGSSFFGGHGSRNPKVFDPRSPDDYTIRPSHEKIMRKDRPLLPNPPRRAKRR